MSKLLRANFARLWKSQVFWVGFFAMAVFCIIQKIGIGLSQDTTEVHYLEEAFWVQALVIGITLSVFISLFVGDEYEYGTIRNKIISGHCRLDIYLANVVVCIVAGWIMCLGCMIFSLVTGIYFLGFFHSGFADIIAEGICLLALSAAYTAIYFFFAILISNRAITAVVCVLISYLLLFAGNAVANRLDESEYFYSPDVTLGIGEIDDGSSSEWVHNPNYLEGAKRRIYEIAFEVNPGGQSLQLSGMLYERTHYIEMFAASAAWIVLSCSCGVALFKRKNVK